MSAIQGCTPVFSVAGIVFSGVLSIVFGVAAMETLAEPRELSIHVLRERPGLTGPHIG